jgi:molybdopterin molybdotransferase
VLNISLLFGTINLKKESFVPVTITEAISLILKHTHPTKSELVPLENALGRISYQNIEATIALPTFNNSAMDGFALKGTSDNYQIVGKILAGDAHSYNLKEGECIRIMTGAEVPISAESIIPQENTTITDDTIMIIQAVKPGANIRHRGEDINEGESILQKGEKITSAHISLLASQGITHLKVYRIPKVAIFASGSELKLHFETLNKSQIYNSNTPYLIARSKELGCETIFVGKAEDSIEALQALIEASLDCDLIVTSGGVSVGEADFTKAAFSELGCEPLFSKIAIKPGKPTTFGKIANTLILNLPGNPLASSLNFELFGKLLLMKLQGLQTIHHSFIETVISQEFSMNRPVDTILPGFFDGKRFTPAEKFAPGNVNVLNHCNGMIVIDKETTRLEDGDGVKFMPIRWEFLQKEFVKFTS